MLVSLHAVVRNLAKTGTLFYGEIVANTPPGQRNRVIENRNFSGIAVILSC